MQSRTSAFNKTLFWKTLRRFWPIWAMYFGAWFLVLPASVNSQLRWSASAIRLQSTIFTTVQYGGVIIGMIAAIAAVMAVWSFMYSSRSVSGMACLPISRTGVFFSVSLAGFLPLVAINLVIALITLGVEAIYGVASVSELAQWFGLCSLELVLFFGFALLCAQLTGNLVVLPVVYAVLNFTAFVVESLVREMLRMFVYGMSGGGMFFVALSPPVWMLTNVQSTSVRVLNAEQVFEISAYTIGGWGGVCIYAVVGLVFAALALALYKRRSMESAGDVVAVGWLRPVFKYCMTFGCALVIGWVIYSFSGADGGGMGSMLVLLAVMLFGAFVGYFASEMLIKKSFRVFRAGWAGFGISAAVIVLVMCAAEFDLFGYERYVPQVDSITRVSVNAMGESAGLEEPENIALAAELHQSIIDGKRENESFSTVGLDERGSIIEIDYTLKNGKTVSRIYNIRWNETSGENTGDILAAQSLLNRKEAIISRKKTRFEYTRENIFSAYINLVCTADELERLEADGRIADVSYFDEDGDYLDYDISTKTEVAAMSDHAEVTVSLTLDEAYELYTSCILPDIADGTLGRVWLITDESYYQTAAAMTINLDARKLVSREEAKNIGYTGDSYVYDYFYTNPTVDSARTNLWLEQHGIPVHMRAEFE